MVVFFCFPYIKAIVVNNIIIIPIFPRSYITVCGMMLLYAYIYILFVLVPIIIFVIICAQYCLHTDIHCTESVSVVVIVFYVKIYGGY